MGDDHVAEGAGRLVELDPILDAERLGDVDLDVVDELRLQIGSNSPLANRNARMFCAASLPRKWSIRKIWSSSKTSWTALSSRALARSVPNGFSMMIRECSTSPASRRVSITASAALGGTLR